ncbi:MAG: dUTP diphosphatase [Clostridia bacterium]|nr:dUTP diphosphatase [Clostridia bacterium]
MNNNGVTLKRLHVAVKKLKESAVLPAYGSEYSAGADLYSCIDGDIEIKPNETVFIPTGLAFEIPVGLVGLVYARSGLACKRGLAPANKVGVIDSDYRGEVMVALHNHSDKPQTVAVGERVAQMVIAPYIPAEFVECEELSDTVRGAGGFGSTGRK